MENSSWKNRSRHAWGLNRNDVRRAALSGPRGPRMKKILALVIVVLAAQLLVIAQALAPAPRPAVLQNYPAITAEQLKAPADGAWPMVRRTYDGWGYSPLDQITKANVARLQPVGSM